MRKKRSIKRVIYDALDEKVRKRTIISSLVRKTKFERDVIVKALTEMESMGVVEPQGKWWKISRRVTDEKELGEGPKIISWAERKRKVDPDYFKRKQREHREKRRFKADEILGVFYEKGCRVCGEMERCCLSAHHLDSSNKKKVSLIRAKGRASELREELKKCIPLCENCHRKLHAGAISVDSEGNGY